MRLISSSIYQIREDRESIWNCWDAISISTINNLPSDDDVDEDKDGAADSGDEDEGKDEVEIKDKDKDDGTESGLNPESSLITCSSKSSSLTVSYGGGSYFLMSSLRASR